MGTSELITARREGTRRRIVATIAALSMLPAVFAAVIFAEPASAALPNPSTFDPGNIISDAAFYDGNAMTEPQIQSFLAAQGSVLASYRSSVSSRGPIVSDQARPGHVYCSGFEGGANLLASTIIFRAQKACGISAKAILVTLQKEQGLITSGTASAYALRSAMGYACPDTAPCDVTHNGFGNQVYMASLQFKYYQLPENGYRYRVGNVYVLYHPNPNLNCGGTTVNIKNWATAGLYNYTPYQPDSAALASYPGMGGSCSSYGNRNFWFLYHHWFGSPLSYDPLGEIADHYASLGGASGELGAATGTIPPCNTNSLSCSRTFEHGVIHWTRGGGPAAVFGPLGDYYLAKGGVASTFGPPAADTARVTDLNGNGYAQSFPNGWIHSSSAGTFATPNNFMSAYSAAGWLRGKLGWPTSELHCGGAQTLCVQDFAGGFITGPTVGAAQVMSDEFLTLYRVAGGPSGRLGYPLGLATAITDRNGDGTVQRFEMGWIHSGTPGAFEISNEFMTAYSAEGWLRGRLGWPTSAMACDSGRCIQFFQGGQILKPANGVAFAVPAVENAQIRATYESLGGASGQLGLALAAAGWVTDPNGDGYVQRFEGGWIHSGPSGAFATSNNLMAAYSAHGWLRGQLGWPSSPETCDANRCAQYFAGWQLVKSTTGASYTQVAVTHAQIRAAYDSLGGANGILGSVVGHVAFVTDPNGNGYVQRFQGGYIHASEAGAFATTGDMMAAYSAGGWVRGSLGWPTSAISCAASGCTQNFEGGQILKPTNGSAFVIPAVDNPPIRALYESLGGATGQLGYPTGPAAYVADTNGNGYVQQFQNAWVHSSSAGTFATSRTLMTKYSAAGWLRGHLGWPTSVETCNAGQCSQQFQGGTLP